jgi:predicted nucleotide-binding protein (sugar kinase/HSP70/actin superfamily)
MAKKSFRTGIDSLIESNIDDINEMTNSYKEEKIVKSENTDLGSINIEDLSDEKVKWLLIKLRRSQDELKLWRTGKLTKEIFHKSLKEKGLAYNSETNDFEEL